MATSATVIEDSLQREGRRVSYRFDFDNGQFVSYGAKYIDEQTNPQADADALIPMIEAQATEQERDEYLVHVAGGGMPGDFTLFFNSRNQLNVLMFKRTLNLMRVANTNEDKWQILKNVVPIVAGFTDLQIANAVGWTEVKVANARARIVALKQAQDNLDHGEPEFDD